MKDDGQNGNYEKERQELLDRFRKALANPDGGEASQWFDEDDLLDVFDYAGDIGNDYLRAEALLWGARYFPDSQRLKERRGVFYSDVLSDSDVEAFTADNGEVTTLLTELLSLRARPLTGEQVREQLIELTDKYDSFNDEEAIQLVNLAADTGNLDWIEENLDVLCAKTEYLPSLLYEVGCEAIGCGRAKMAATVFHRLVEEAPYNADFWSALARAEFALNNADASRDAWEMALAIDPQHVDARQIKAKFLAESSKAVNAQEELDAMAADFPDDDYIAEVRLGYLLNDENLIYPSDRAGREIMDAVRRFPDNEQIFQYMTIFAPEGSAEKLAEYFELNYRLSDLPHWCDWVMGMNNTGAFRGVILVAKCMLDKIDAEDIPSVIHCLAVALLMTQDFGGCLTIIDAYETIGQCTTPTLLVARMLSLVRAHQYKKAIAFAENVYLRKHVPVNASAYPEKLARILTMAGVYKFAYELKSYCPRSRAQADKFDPFGLWKNS